ncbi:RAD52 motif-containing protein 1 isoform X2 [Myripristis murdjan]|uniref:RAD52 motif-containing protein 1 isoform X2 n=1 Tax=Myripristis murdjan TaxID=586833 RepID=UPI0011760D34|nr:RAD52 motif-containing protein 1 isoform X2 [Myripristis murdjan]
MDPEVVILEFLVPVENNKTLLVWDIQPSHTEAFIQESLSRVFSSFGPLYLVRVRPNAPLAPAGFYALIKFYSAAHAARAQRRTDGRSLFQSTPLKVRLSTKQTPSHLLNPGSSRPLSHAHCLELANHCLGFNGWSTRIITLKELSSEEEEEEEEEGGRRKVCFGCQVELIFPQQRQTARGAAVLQDSCCESSLQRRCKLQRRVKEKAVVQAFSSVLLILLGDGRVLVEVRQDRDQTGVLPDQTGVLQVNELSWSEVLPEEGEEEEEEEEGCDLTVY